MSGVAASDIPSPPGSNMDSLQAEHFVHRFIAKGKRRKEYYASLEAASEFFTLCNRLGVPYLQQFQSAYEHFEADAALCSMDAAMLHWVGLQYDPAERCQKVRADFDTLFNKASDVRTRFLALHKIVMAREPDVCKRRGMIVLGTIGAVILSAGAVMLALHLLPATICAVSLSTAVIVGATSGVVAGMCSATVGFGSLLWKGDDMLKAHELAVAHTDSVHNAARTAEEHLAQIKACLGEQRSGGGDVPARPAAAAPAAAAAAAAEHYPSHFICGLSGKKMVDPVVSSQGYSYERVALEAHLDASENPKCPTTGSVLTRTVVPNISLRNEINRFQLTPELILFNSRRKDVRAKLQKIIAHLKGVINLARRTVDGNEDHHAGVDGHAADGTQFGVASDAAPGTTNGAVAAAAGGGAKDVEIHDLSPAQAAQFLLPSRRQRRKQVEAMLKFSTKELGAIARGADKAEARWYDWFRGKPYRTQLETKLRVLNSMEQF